MFHVRSVSEHNFNEPIDQQSIIIANIMRTKDNTAQLIVGTLLGNIYITQFSKQFSHQDVIAEVKTGQPILGLLVGSFSQPYVVLPSEPQERLEIAVIHPRQVQVYSPSRDRETGAISLQCLYTIELDGHHAASFTACHRRNTILDQNKNKRLSIHSWIAIKSMTGLLMIIQGSKIVQKVTMSHQYALPTPITFNPLSDQLIIATFEYDVIGIQMQRILQMQAQEGNEQKSENDTNTQTGLIPAFKIGLNSRIQQLECGRFFMGDSSINGEVAVVSQDTLIFIDSEGKLVKEVKTDERISWIQPVQWQGDSRALGKHPQIISTLVLLETDEVLIIQAGIIKWRGLPPQGDITVLEIQMGNMEVLSDVQQVSISENSSHIDLKHFAGSFVDLGNASNHSINGEKQYVLDGNQNDENKIDLDDQNNEVRREIVNEIKGPEIDEPIKESNHEGKTEEKNGLPAIKNNITSLAKPVMSRQPLRATQAMKKAFDNAQLGDLPEMNHILLVQGPVCLGANFMGHIVAPSVFPQRQGLFILASSNAHVRVCFFGTTVDHVGNLLPEKMPSAESSRQLRERLQAQLEQLRATRENHDFADDAITLQCTFTGIQFTGSQIVTSGQLSFKQSQYDEIVDLNMVVLSLNDTFQIENRHFKSGLTTQNFKMMINKGQFVSLQRISCGVHFKTYNEGGELVPGQFSVLVRVPLLSFCTIDSVELEKAKQLKFQALLRLQTPATSIQQFIRRNCGAIGESAAQKIDQSNESGSEHALALCQANGSIVCMAVENNNAIRLYGPGYEVFFMAVEFLSQGTENFVIDCDKTQFSQYILDCYRKQKAMNTAEKEMEDELVKRVDEYDRVNQKLNDDFLAQENPILDFQDDKSYTNIAEHLGVLQIYIEQLLKRLDRFSIEKQNCIEKIKAMLFFAIQIKAKCDPSTIDKLSADFLETELDVLDKAIKQHIGGSNIEHLINHLLN